MVISFVLASYVLHSAVARCRPSSLKHGRTTQKASTTRRSHIIDRSTHADYPQNFPSASRAITSGTYAVLVLIHVILVNLSTNSGQACRTIYLAECLLPLCFRSQRHQNTETAPVLRQGALQASCNVCQLQSRPMISCSGRLAISHFKLDGSTVYTRLKHYLLDRLFTFTTHQRVMILACISARRPPIPPPQTVGNY